MSHIIGLLVSFASMVGIWVWMFATDGQIDKLHALLTPAVALLAACIALGQWHIARNKLKLELFKSRHEVYEATRAAIFLIIQHRVLEPDQHQEFLRKTAGVMWLFDPGVREYVNELEERIQQLSNYGLQVVSAKEQENWERMQPEKNGEAIRRFQAAADHARQKQGEHVRWCQSQINNRYLEKLFEEFLVIKH